MTDEPRAICSGVLTIGDMSFPCSVLSDDTRILTQSDFMSGMGMYYSGWVAKHGPAEMPHFLSFKSLKPFVEQHLGDLQSITMRYRTERGALAIGVKADTIPKMCDVWIDAKEHGTLGSRQKQVAAKALLLVRALAHVGIIGLVDEATGYQEIRTKRALATILEKFITTELQPWTKTFPYEFYEQIYRLKGWPGPDGHKRSPLIGRYTNDIVYERIAPGVLDELKLLTPKLPSGNRRNKFFQWFTPDFGHPRLKEHLAAVMAMMRAAPNWNRFRGDLNRAFPKMNETIPLPLDD